MITKQPTTYMRMKKLRADLRYYQMLARLDTRCLKASIERVKVIAQEMKTVQKEKSNAIKKIPLHTK